MTKTKKQPRSKGWKNRIVGHGEEDPEQLFANPDNWRVHPKFQMDALEAMIDDVGVVDSVMVNVTTGRMVDGHARVQLAVKRKEPKIPVDYVELTEEEERKVLMTFDPISMMAKADADMLERLLKETAVPHENLDQMLQEAIDNARVYALTESTRAEKLEIVAQSKGDKRLTKIDLIWTAGTFGENSVLVHCCMAVRMGWKYGIRSTGGACSSYNRIKNHDVCFIDNDFHNYDHSKHLECVAKHRPKYATVLDVMTKTQCREAGMKYRDMDQILKWAEEVNEYAENVIIIPKWDCVDKIPEKYVLGYSVPSSYGGTPLPLKHFQGRRVHLLGGSPNRQIECWAALPDEVVSLDNNYILKMARYAQVWTQTGLSASLSDLVGSVRAPYYVTLAVSLANFASYFGKDQQDLGIESDDLRDTREVDSEIQQARAV